MLKKSKVIWIALLLVFAALFGGLLHLFSLRFEGGDVYPAYSSLRTDPLGTKALFESLQDVPGLSVSRFFEPLRKLENGRDTTLFIFGSPSFELNYASEQEVKLLERFMLDGGRVVVTLYPEGIKSWSTRHQEALQKSQRQRIQKGKSAGDDEAEKMISLKDRWNFDYAYQDLHKDEKGVSEPAEAKLKIDGSALPESMSWHSAIYFSDLSNKWDTVYAREDLPVLIERSFGKGKMVFSSDSYFLSNEAMRKERQPELLSWIVGQNHALVFEETHLGVKNDPGVAALARKYGLHGLILGLVLLAALFVWKNSISFVPPIEEDVFEKNSAVVVGKESAAGFVNLLRRNIPASGILMVCVAEWKKSCAHQRQEFLAKVDLLEGIAEREKARSLRERDPVGSYQAISRILERKK